MPTARARPAKRHIEGMGRALEGHGKGMGRACQGKDTSIKSRGTARARIFRPEKSDPDTDITIKYLTLKLFTLLALPQVKRASDSHLSQWAQER